MRSRVLSPPMQTLYRIFVAPALQKTYTTAAVVTRPLHHTTTLRPSTIRQVTYPTSLTTHHQTAHFSTTRPNLATRPPEKRAQLWDEEIPALRACVVDPGTKSLGQPQSIKHILANLIDRKTHRLVCMSAPPEGHVDPRLNRQPQRRGRFRRDEMEEEDQDEEKEEWIPTCRIISKKEQYELDRQRQKQKVQAKKNSGEASTKTVELSWAIDGNDLAHRMKKVVEFLNEGRKVEVVLAKKKGGRKATGEECEGVVARILETVEGVKGAKVGKAMEGKVGGVLTLFFEGVKEKDKVAEGKKKDGKVEKAAVAE